VVEKTKVAKTTRREDKRYGSDEEQKERARKGRACESRKGQLTILIRQKNKRSKERKSLYVRVELDPLLGGTGVAVVRVVDRVERPVRHRSRRATDRRGESLEEDDQ
jgi:hypothetical protein